MTRTDLAERIRARRFGDDDVRNGLDEMAFAAVERTLGPADAVQTYHAPGTGRWRQGDGRPSLADDDPAVMQAIGRCAAYRVRRDHRTGDVFPLDVSAVHPEPCAWCDYPLTELLIACDWATFASRYVITEQATWRNADGLEYHRAARSDVYDNPRWRDFWALPTFDRERRISAAMYLDTVLH